MVQRLGSLAKRLLPKGSLHGSGGGLDKVQRKPAETRACAAGHLYLCLLVEQVGCEGLSQEGVVGRARWPCSPLLVPLVCAGFWQGAVLPAEPAISWGPERDSSGSNAKFPRCFRLFGVVLFKRVFPSVSCSWWVFRS